MWNYTVSIKIKNTCITASSVTTTPSVSPEVSYSKRRLKGQREIHLCQTTLPFAFVRQTMIIGFSPFQRHRLIGTFLFPRSNLPSQDPVSLTPLVYHFYQLSNRSPRRQALVYDILPSTTAVFSYVISPRKLWANEQFFCWCSNSSKFVTVISLLQTTQIKQGVSFIAANKVYTSTNKTTIVWTETELFFFF